MSAVSIGPEVRIVLTNAAAAPVYVPRVGCSGAVIYTLQHDEAGAVNPRVDDDCMPQICDDFSAAQDCSQDCADCAARPPLLIPAGGSTTVVWSGVNYIPLQLSADCSPASCAGSLDCARADQAPSGSYAVFMSLFTSCDGGDIACLCPVPNGLESCELAGTPSLGGPTDISGPLIYPDEGTIELIFGP